MNKANDIVYVNYMNCEDKYKTTSLGFEGESAYKDALKWAGENLEKWDSDCLTYNDPKAEPSRTSIAETWYIEYLNASKNLEKTRVEFKGPKGMEDALNWGKNNLGNFNSNMVKKEISKEPKKEKGKGMSF